MNFRDRKSQACCLALVTAAFLTGNFIAMPLPAQEINDSISDEELS